MIAPNEGPFRVHKNRLINSTHVRRFLLDYAKETRAQKFTRVSEDTLTRINEAVRMWCIAHVTHHPSVGKTL